jgi:hypothetical protein
MIRWYKKITIINSLLIIFQVEIELLYIFNILYFYCFIQKKLPGDYQDNSTVVYSQNIAIFQWRHESGRSAHLCGRDCLLRHHSRRFASSILFKCKQIWYENARCLFGSHLSKGVSYISIKYAILSYVLFKNIRIPRL